MRSSLLRTALQGILGSNPAVGIGAAVVGVTGLTVGGVIGVTSVTRSACAAPAPDTVVTATADVRCDTPAAAEGSTTGTDSTDPTDLPGGGSGESLGDAAPDRTGASEEAGPGTASSADAASTDETGGDRPTDTSTTGGDAPATPSGPAAATAVTTTTAPKPFRISGTVTGLTPGSARRLRLRIDNPNSDAIRILDVEVTVGDLPGCPGSNLQVDGYRASKPGAARVIVPARSSATLEVQAALRTTVGSQDACRGRTFPLSFAGNAEQWSGR